MATRNIAHRRKVRALETRRDTLTEQAAKIKQQLAATRAELKSQRKARI
jgi:hypothetical protein